MERDIENALVKDITKLLLKLGTGFAFLGNQYHINVGGDDFYIDLLFYNLNLRCYVVIELKTKEFLQYMIEYDFDSYKVAQAMNTDINLVGIKCRHSIGAKGIPFRRMDVDSRFLK